MYFWYQTFFEIEAFDIIIIFYIHIYTVDTITRTERLLCHQKFHKKTFLSTQFAVTAQLFPNQPSDILNKNCFPPTKTHKPYLFYHRTLLLHLQLYYIIFERLGYRYKRQRQFIGTVGC